MRRVLDAALEDEDTLKDDEFGSGVDFDDPDDPDELDDLDFEDDEESDEE